MTLDVYAEKSIIEDPCLVCGGESDYGHHGLRDGEVYSEYYCEKHHHSGARNLGVSNKSQEFLDTDGIKALS